MESRSLELSREYRIPSIPILIIDGRYMLEISDNGDFAGQLEVAKELIDQTREIKGDTN